MTDVRTVHAENDDFAIVRYDKAGKWYIASKHTGSKIQVKLAQAVSRAMELWSKGGTVHFGRYGGSTFDRKVRAACDVEGAETPLCVHGSTEVCRCCNIEAGYDEAHSHTDGTDHTHFAGWTPHNHESVPDEGTPNG